MGARPDVSREFHNSPFISWARVLTEIQGKEGGSWWLMELPGGRLLMGVKILGQDKRGVSVEEGSVGFNLSDSLKKKKRNLVLTSFIFGGAGGKRSVG